MLWLLLWLLLPLLLPWLKLPHASPLPTVTSGVAVRDDVRLSVTSSWNVSLCRCSETVAKDNSEMMVRTAAEQYNTGCLYTKQCLSFPSSISVALVFTCCLFAVVWLLVNLSAVRHARISSLLQQSDCSLSQIGQHSSDYFKLNCCPI